MRLDEHAVQYLVAGFAFQLQPYRQKLVLMSHRLRQMFRYPSEADGGYGSAQET